MKQTIVKMFNKFISEPMPRDLCLKINAVLGVLMMLSSILGLIVSTLKGLPYGSWTVISSPIIGLFFVSGWLLRKQSKVKLDSLLVVQGVILLIGLGYALIQITGWASSWQHTSGYKRVGLSPGIMTLLSVYTFRLIGDFGFKNYPRKVVTLTALFFGLFLEMLMIVQFVRIQHLG